MTDSAMIVFFSLLEASSISRTRILRISTRESMAKPNYTFEKRQKEIAKKKKKEEKLLKKARANESQLQADESAVDQPVAGCGDSAAPVDEA